MSAEPSGEHWRPGPGPAVPAENAEELYEHAPCGYLSTLPDGTIIRVNETLRTWLGHGTDELVGHRRFSDLLTPGGRIYHETHYAPLLAMQGTVRAIAFDMQCADGRRLPVLVNAALVRSPSGAPEVIRISVFDATDRREYERELLRARKRAERSEAHAKELAQTLQASLIPPSEPSIPGLDVGAAYRPAGAGDEVGGDFYDVFEARSDDWAVVIGDVCGKGAEAATVTALARHTIRASALHMRRPSAVLADLNAVLLRHPTDRFTTVAYLRVRRDAGGAIHVTVASGGHPLPMRITPVDVRPIGTPGSLLGVLDDAELHDTTFELEPGEALFCYTDGLTEGRQGEEWFGEQRLVETLATHRGRLASDVARSVIEEIVEFQHGSPRDDMAAVVLAVPHLHERGSRARRRIQGPDA